MREIPACAIEAAVCEMLITCNRQIGGDIRGALQSACAQEPSPVGRQVLANLLDNAEIAETEGIAICQDTGMSVLFVEYGQEVVVTGGGFEEAINRGVAKAYETGSLRKSVVDDPLFDRVNTADNTPAIVHTRIVPGENMHITAGCKGFGSENMSAVKMLTPAQGVSGAKEFVLETVFRAGPNACPPMVIGVGIGGTMEQAAMLAKRATFDKLGTRHADARYSALAGELLREINQMGTGPAGMGGKTTALGVNIRTCPTHIAGLPVAVNICCHACRHGEVTL